MPKTVYVNAGTDEYEIEVADDYKLPQFYTNEWVEIVGLDETMLLHSNRIAVAIVKPKPCSCEPPSACSKCPRAA